MKILPLLLLPLVFFSASLTARPQDASQQAISQLQQEIAKREALDRDESIPADLKAQNRAILDKRRAELVTAIQARITALQKYIESLGNSATAEEKEYVQNSLKNLSAVTNTTAGVPSPSNSASPSNGNGSAFVNNAASNGNANTTITAPANTTSASPQTPPFTITGTVTVMNEQFYQNNATSTSPTLRPGFSSKVNVPLKNAKIVAEKLTNPNGTRDTKTTTYTDSSGNYTLTLTESGNYIISAADGDFKTEESVTINSSTTVDLQLLVRPLGEYSRAIVGLEQAAASSAESEQKFFFDLTLSAPMPFGKVDPFFGRRGRMWGTARVTSVPQQINSGVATFAAGFAQQVGNLKVNEVAQGIEFLAGAEIRLTHRMAPFGSFDRSTTNRFSLSLIAAGGATTPINPKTTLEIFRVFADAPGLPPIPAGKDFIAFVSPDRDRFFRQYYGGIRLQTYYFDYDNPDIPLKRFPAVLDITFGQNEAVTGGRLRGGVLRLEGFYPLPYDGLKFINVFGTALMKFTRSNITDPLILELAPQGTTVPANNVFLQTVPQINRDYYRIGVGIDLMSLINRMRAAQ